MITFGVTILREPPRRRRCYGTLPDSRSPARTRRATCGAWGEIVVERQSEIRARRMVVL